MKNIFKVMDISFYKECGEENTDYYEVTEKREVEAYNLGNRLAERSCKNIEANLLLEHLLLMIWLLSKLSIQKVSAEVLLG